MNDDEIPMVGGSEGTPTDSDRVTTDKAGRVVVVLAFVGVMLFAIGSCVSGVAKMGAASSAADATASEPYYTAAQFAQLSPGQSLPEVEAILGGAGENTYRAPGASTYQWVNPDGSNVQVTFIEGVVYSKAQYGLQ